MIYQRDRSHDLRGQMDRRIALTPTVRGHSLPQPHRWALVAPLAVAIALWVLA